MKVSANWLREVLGRTMSDQQIVDRLEQAGIEVEQLISAKPIDKKVKISLVKEIVQHPAADRLKVVSIDTGDGLVKVVCGAPNVRPGMLVAWAPPGTTLPGGQQIEIANLRGVESQGMLCSERELGLGPDHNGILELDSALKAGTTLCDVVSSDSVVDITTHANRFDLLSVVGLAREIAAMEGEPLKWREQKLLKPTGEGPEVRLEVGEKLVPQFVLAHVKKNTVSKSTATEHANWLKAAGMRLISPIVDITNLVMLELGQPLHAYDANKVKLPIIVRHAIADERLTTLDGVERTLTPDDLVIADSAGPLGLAGVMGGARAEVDTHTTEILLEAATFDAATVRKMAGRHNLRSEASARFERELPVQLAPLALARAAEQIGGEVVGLTHQLRIWPWVQRIGLRASTLSSLLGFDVSRDEAVAALAKLGIEAVPFDIVEEAKKHLGKPYIWGASFKKTGTTGFDCSYLTDYLYSLIGEQVGFTTLAQFEIGRPVNEADLKPGDILFYRGALTEGKRDFTLEELNSGQQPVSAVGFYYRRDEATGKYIRIEAKTKALVGHNGLYIGEGKVIHAAKFEFQDGKWTERSHPDVHEVSLETYTANPGYLGARRFIDNLDEFISVPAVPWWRPDLKLPEDLVEEVVRVLGYDRVPATLPRWQPSSMTFDRTRPRLWRLQELLQGLGLFEVMTYSFVSEHQLTELGYDPKDYLKLRNPLSLEQAYLRRELLPSLLAVAARNVGYGREFALYEISKVFLRRADHQDQPDEPLRLGMLFRSPEQALVQLRGRLEKLRQAFPTELVITNASVPHMIPGRSGQIELAGKPIGSIGQLLPQYLRNHKLTGEMAYLELGLDPILGAMTDEHYQPIPRFPVISRDLSLVVDPNVAWADIERALSDNSQVKYDFISDYYNATEQNNKKIITFRLTISHSDRTPTDEEAQAAVDIAVEVLAAKLDASTQG